jgi:hypothetical protein
MQYLLSKLSYAEPYTDLSPTFLTVLRRYFRVLGFLVFHAEVEIRVVKRHSYEVISFINVATNAFRL